MNRLSNVIILSLKEANRIGDLLEDGYQLAGAVGKLNVSQLDKFRKTADDLWKTIAIKP